MVAFCSNAEDLPNEKLYAWYSESPLGPWYAHKMNPLKWDVRTSRPAGRPIIYGGKLFRLAQDCGSTYGGAVVINQVERLSPDDFEERVIKVIRCDVKGDGFSGIHTICAV